jgi:hypothetical protein
MSSRLSGLMFCLITIVAIICSILYLSSWKITEPVSDLLASIIWPAAVIVVMVLYRHELAQTLLVLIGRIQRGHGFKFGMFEIHGVSDSIPVPSSPDETTLMNIALLHTSFLSERGTAKIGDGKTYYQFELIVIARRSLLSKVKKVTYFLPDAWPEPNRIHVVTDASSKFKMKELANGTAIVYAEIEIEGKSEPVRLNRFIDLRAEGPRI